MGTLARLRFNGFTDYLVTNSLSSSVSDVILDKGLNRKFTFLPTGKCLSSRRVQPSSDQKTRLQPQGDFRYHKREACNSLVSLLTTFMFDYVQSCIQCEIHSLEIIIHFRTATIPILLSTFAKILMHSQPADPELQDQIWLIFRKYALTLLSYFLSLISLVYEDF